MNDKEVSKQITQARQLRLAASPQAALTRKTADGAVYQAGGRGEGQRDCRGRGGGATLAWHVGGAHWQRPPQEFNIEKLQLVEAEKAKVRKEYERKEASVDVKRKMCVLWRGTRGLNAHPARSEYSTQLNATRLKVLAAREAAMAGLLAEAAAKLASLAAPASPGYRALLAALLSQAVAQLGGVPCVVRCRAVDAPAVVEAAASFSARGVAIALDPAGHLPPPPDPARPDAPHSLGGLVVSTLDGKTSVNNTLEERLGVAYAANVPDLRVKIFGRSGGHLRV